MEAQIKQSLNSLLDNIKQSNSTAVGQDMERLEALLATGRAHLHPQLVHFLERRSYAKALMFLGGETDIPVGACGGRPAK